ncbi:hypothetical protein KAR91_72075 [Candidatus Pacearchaeota archaeon]|nr:hypothetical protein [Candidatus Pacearchaeota archaeon]
MIISTTMTVRAIFSPKTGKFHGIEIEMPMNTFFIADDQGLWPGIRAGNFPPSSSRNAHWTNKKLIGDIT